MSLRHRFEQLMDRVLDYHARKSPRVYQWIGSGGLLALFGITFIETEAWTAPGLNIGSRACLALWGFWMFTAFCQAHGRYLRQRDRSDRLQSLDTATKFYYRQNLAKLDEIKAMIDEGDAWKR